MEKRYQVFVSSTYEDLQEERQEVMQALLELDCIPCGMELFPAANEDQWTLIQRVIDDCDYYIVIVGGRYGTTRPDGISYTEIEYRYAIEKGKPVIGFLHKAPEELAAKKSETTEKGRKALVAFRGLVSEKMCQFWTSPAELGSKVSRSIVKLMKAHPAIGWVRADALPSEDTTKEILDLRKQIDVLEKELKASVTEPPEGSSSLTQGEDTTGLVYTFHGTDAEFKDWIMTRYFEATWDDIFATVSPLMIDEASDQALRSCLNRYVENERARYHRNDDKEFDGWRSLHSFSLKEDVFQTIKVQLRALGLMAKSVRQRSVKDTNTYWTLTPYGDTVMTQLRAIKRVAPKPKPRRKAKKRTSS